MTTHSKRTGSSGFTLIELMIVVAVVAMLTAIAVPVYNDQVRRSRRAQAQSDLAQIVQCMERFNTTNGTYVGGDARCLPTDTDHYTYAIDIPGRNAFTARSTAINSQANDSCGNLGLDQAGQKTHSSGTDCWR